MSVAPTVVVDYGAGNLRSVENVLRHLGARFTVTSDPAVVDAAESLALQRARTLFRRERMIEQVDELYRRCAELLQARADGRPDAGRSPPPGSAPGADRPEG